MSDGEESAHENSHSHLLLEQQELEERESKKFPGIFVRLPVKILAPEIKNSTPLNKNKSKNKTEKEKCSVCDEYFDHNQHKAMWHPLLPGIKICTKCIDKGQIGEYCRQVTKSEAGLDDENMYSLFYCIWCADGGDLVSSIDHFVYIYIYILIP